MPQGKTWQKEVNRLKYLLTEKEQLNKRLFIKNERFKLALKAVDEQRGFILEGLHCVDPQLIEALNMVKKLRKHWEAK